MTTPTDQKTLRDEFAMAAPRRVQLSRKKGWKMPPNTVKVDRSTRWGNPFRADDHFGVTRSIWLFRMWAAPETAGRVLPPEARIEQDSAARLRAELPRLRGKNLACWCALDQPCHADVLLELANAPALARKRETEE